MHHRAPGPVHRGNGHAGDLYDVEALDSRSGTAHRHGEGKDS